MSSYHKKAKRKLYSNLPFLGAIGSTCSIVAFLFGIFTDNNWVLAPGYAVFAVSLSMIAFSEMQHRKNAEIERNQHKTQLDNLHSRLSIYENKTNSFHLGFHTLREATTFLIVWDKLDDDKNERFISCLSESLTRLSEFFSNLTKHDCSLCIKTLVEPDDQDISDYNSIKFTTLVRDKKSQWRISENDRLYTLMGNTAFRSIWVDNDRRWFYSSDLSIEKDYYNENPMWMKNKHYLTTAVIPIQAPKISKEGKEYHGIKGYLAIDSPDVNAFPEQPTVFLLACFADILYITLTLYQAFEKKRN